MTQPEKSFENPILFDDGSEEEALLKSKGIRSAQKPSLPDIEVDKSKLLSGESAPASLPPIEVVPDEAESEDSLDLVNQLLEDFGNENLEDTTDEDIELEDDDDEEDGITLEDEDEFDDEDYDTDDTVDIDPEILQFLQEVNLEEETEEEEKEWVIDEVKNSDDDEEDGQFTFAPLEDEQEDSSTDDELFEEFTTIAPDDEEEIPVEESDDVEEEESSIKKIGGKLKDKLATMKENIRSEIGDGGKKQAESTDTDPGTESANPGIISKVHSFFLNVLLKIAGLLAKLPFVGKFFEPTEKLMVILGRIAYFVPLILLVILFFITNNMAINKTEVHDLPDEGQVTVQDARFNQENNTMEAKMVNTGDVIAESRVDFSVKSTQLSINPVHWFIPQEVTTCSTDWVTVDLDDIQDITASCEEKELSGFWYRGSIEVVE